MAEEASSSYSGPATEVPSLPLNLTFQAGDVHAEALSVRLPSSVIDNAPETDSRMGAWGSSLDVQAESTINEAEASLLVGHASVGA